LLDDTESAIIISSRCSRFFILSSSLQCTFECEWTVMVHNVYTQRRFFVCKETIVAVNCRKWRWYISYIHSLIQSHAHSVRRAMKQLAPASKSEQMTRWGCMRNEMHAQPLWRLQRQVKHHQ